MPNKRAENKRIVSTYVDADIKAELQRLAKSEGKTLTDIVTELIKERVKWTKRKSQ